MGVLIAGVDPGLATFGYVTIRVEMNNLRERNVEVRRVKVMKTKPANKKERRSDEDLRARLKAITDFIVGEMAAEGIKPRILVMESLSFPRNASSAAKIALAYGATQAICNTSSIPIMCYRPQEIKMACGLTKSASKQEVEDWIRRIWPSDLWPSNSDREHAFDAAAAIHAFLNDNSWTSFLLGTNL